jgi:hypothetical protein
VIGNFIKMNIEIKNKLTLVFSWIYFINEDVPELLLNGSTCFSEGITFVDRGVSVMFCSLCGSCQATEKIVFMCKWMVNRLWVFKNKRKWEIQYSILNSYWVSWDDCTRKISFRRKSRSLQI